MKTFWIIAFCLFTKVVFAGLKFNDLKHLSVTQMQKRDISNRANTVSQQCTTMKLDVDPLIPLLK